MVDYIGPLPLWRGQRFILTGIAKYSTNAFVLATHNASVSIAICEFTECFMHCQGILYCIASDWKSFRNGEGVELAHWN